MTADDARPPTLADLIDDWHASRPETSARLARALGRVGPVLDRLAIYSGEYHAPDRLTIRWDAGRMLDEVEFRDGPDGAEKFMAGEPVTDEAIARRWGIPLARNVVAPAIRRARYGPR